ncbi:phenylalanine--tRNA ligase subunit beta [Mycoplasma zalophidermidis]|uniref:phenylalanine--tRNA ligase subunit beta n=1 Tax=Mycoplasma zalophidermidis TaxID=398174 RepID=UPI00215BA972|nr:phenylalanine--tRNA ligase subunit beta [Mycoplasma zalophidermidis]MCR8966771.1 phenylalanine--tRNA ligase subunit beta [Mycoplasma zalophidermidis]
MIVTLKELNKFLPNKKLDLTVEKAINNLGYEVESIAPLSDVEGVKFAKVINVYANPNSKNLTVVELELADNKQITIQTNAKNAKVGCYTTAFVEGASKGGVVFGTKKIAGIESQGMLSNFNELGFDISKLPFKEEDLMMLEQPLPLDIDPVEYFGLDDYIIDITTPANRSDANSYYVLARELAAYYNTEFKWFDWDNKKIINKYKTKISSSKHRADYLAFMECKTYKTNTNLLDMLFLAKHGVEAKNIWAVDISNLTLLYTGAPTHAYDKDKIGNKLTCQNYTGKVKILGDKEIEVNDTLAIFDENKLISLACVIGCSETSVKNDTTHIAFEIGVFDSKKVRHGAKEVKIDSASSIQGGRGVNAHILRFGMKYLQYKAFVDKHPFSNVIGLPKSRLGNSVLQNRKKLALYANTDLGGLKVFEDVEKKLKLIGFRMDKNRIVAPNYRKDIQTFEDIIEEYFRFYGYTNFKPLAPYLIPFKVDKRDISKSLLQAMGYKEVRTFTLDSILNNYLNPFSFENTIKLQTFVSKEREVIRNSIITSMLQVANYNIKRKIDKINIFEKGMINNNKYVIGLVTNIKSFTELKQDIVNYLKTPNLVFVPFIDNEYIHPNVSAKIILNNEMIGWIGKIHARYAKDDLWVAEFKDVKLNTQLIFNEYDSSPLKTLDITFELGKKENIGNKIDEINSKYNVFEIEQIDKFVTDECNKITIRITAESNIIDQINNQYN